MNITARIVTALLLAATLSACGNDEPAPTAADPKAEPETMIGKAIDKAIEEAKQGLATENVGLTSADGKKAEITPNGDLLIDGKTIAIDDKQRQLLLEYRKRTHEIAQAGMAIGSQGADLAGKAVGQAFASVFSGDGEQFEKRMEAEAKKIELQATKLCELLPALLNAQNAVAASMPAFKPYANMTQKDIDDCRADGNASTADGAIGKAIENALNQNATIQVDVDTDKGAGGGLNTAEEAEAAAADTATSQPQREGR